VSISFGFRPLAEVGPVFVDRTLEIEWEIRVKLSKPIRRNSITNSLLDFLSVATFEMERNGDGELFQFLAGFSVRRDIPTG
jgi:hypothetical protein